MINEFKKLGLAVLAVFTFLMLSLPSFAAEYVVLGSISHISSDNRSIDMDDAVYYYSNFTQVMEYQADEDQRLPLKRLSKGDWILVHFSTSKTTNKSIAEKIIILPGKSTINRLTTDDYRVN